MAGEVNLAEHRDFRPLLTTAAARAGVPEAFVEKDYWITILLRTIAVREPERAIFKGGTSLSKGWDMLDRFSEDIDLFFHPSVPEPVSPREVGRRLKALRDACAAQPGLVLVPLPTTGSGRDDTLQYESLFDAVPGFPPEVRLESGVQSGDFPLVTVELTSIVAKEVAAAGGTETLQMEGVDDLEPFEMTLLHFRRTFVEKLFAIHGKVERLKQDGTPIGRDARHYADLHVLGQQPEVRAMLGSSEYTAIRADYDEKSRAYFRNSYRPPPDLRFTTSDALFPPPELRTALEADYAREVGRLYYRSSPPAFAEVLGLMEDLRSLL